MPKRPTYLPHNYYHIFNRGRSKLSICHGPKDYLDIIAKLKQYSRQFKLTVIAYVLLPNHYHLLIRQDDVHRASLIVQHTFNSYSKVYNRKYQHSGTLFEGSAKVLRVEKEQHLLHLCRYIHANPVNHQIVDSIESWPYSNVHEWLETRNGDLVDRDFIQTHFGTKNNYKGFLHDYLSGGEDLPELDIFLPDE